MDKVKAIFTNLILKYKSLRRRDRFFLLTSATCILAALVLICIYRHDATKLKDQDARSRWGVADEFAQITLFFNANAKVDDFTIGNIENSYLSSVATVIASNKKKNETVASDDPYAGTLFTHSASAYGTVNISSDNGLLQDAPVYGVEGDFFLFHPFKLVSGDYLSKDDLMTDYVLLSDLAAWKLFGSSDVVGLTVYVNDYPHLVKGVYELDKNRFNKASGAEEIYAYVSLPTLTELGTTEGISSLEILAANPVKNYALMTIKEKVGSSVSENAFQIVENTNRFSLKNMMVIIKSFGTRSMDKSTIILPYWENIARAYESICAVLLVFIAIFCTYPVLVVLVYITKKFINRDKNWYKIDGVPFYIIWGEKASNRIGAIVKNEVRAIKQSAATENDSDKKTSKKKSKQGQKRLRKEAVKPKKNKEKEKE